MYVNISYRATVQQNDKVVTITILVDERSLAWMACWLSGPHIPTLVIVLCFIVFI